MLLSGEIYTARDQAHKLIVEQIKTHKKLPFDLADAVIYYCGPTATPKGKVIGSCGPTTSKRMDAFVPEFMDKGNLAMIGKGRRNKKVKETIKKHQGIYFVAPSGCGALLAECVVKQEMVCFEDLGPEAIVKLSVKDFPLMVGIDSKGNDIYEWMEKI